LCEHATADTIFAAPTDEVPSLDPAPATEAQGVLACGLGVAGADRGFLPRSTMAASGDPGGSEKCGAEARANADEEET